MLGPPYPGPDFWRDFLIFFGIYLIIALSLNLEYGYTGIPNFGKVLAVAGGAFAVGSFSGRIAWWLSEQSAPAWFSEQLASLKLNNPYMNFDYFIPGVNDRKVIPEVITPILKNDPAISLTLFFAILVIAGIVGAVLGFVACYPAIRLREDYLAIMLLAMGEGIGVIGYNYSPIIGGTIGVAVPDPFGWAGELRYIVILVFILGISLLVLFYLERLVRTPLGRMLRAIRDNEDVAESLGKNVNRIRMKTIIIASIIASIGGALYAFNTCNVISTSYSRVSWTFWPWVIVVLGGAANNMGVILGSFGFIALRRFIDFYKPRLEPYVPFDVIWLYFLLLGIGIILIQMYRPGGIMPEKPTSTLSRKKLEKMVGLRRAVSSSKSEDSTSST